MKEGCQAQAEFAAWVNKEKRIITFRDAEGYEKLTFRSREDRMAYVCHLCESGYRIL